jgi:hypothetical protein
MRVLPAAPGRDCHLPNHTKPFFAQYLPAGVVLVVALALAGVTYQQFLAVDRHLWDNSTHDRNAHYLYALRLATDAQHLRVFRFLDDINQARVWPPLQGLVTAAILMVGGLDYRLGVLPSLAGWVGTVFFGYLLAKRAVPQGGVMAGLVAALFIAASPAHRAYATDIMLESVGACLTLVVLYCYLVLVQSRPQAVWTGRCLALALTTLFLHKYNYWTLTIMAMVATELTLHPKERLQFIWNIVKGIDWRRRLLDQLRRPLNYILAAILAVVAVVMAHGNRPIAWRGQDISLYPPHNLIHAAYVVFFLRVGIWWWKEGRAWSERLDGRVRQLITWHAWPVATWFLLPKHLSYFIWFLSPANANDEQRSSLMEGLAYYTPCVVGDYHQSLWCAALVGGLIVCAVVAGRRLSAGGQVILWLFLLGAVLTAMHPNHKSRYVHSWLAAGWVLAGIGCAALAYGRLTGRIPQVRPYLATAVVGVLGLVLLPSLREAASSPEGGPHPQVVSMLDVTDAYLPEVKSSKQTAIFAAVPVKPLAQWTFLQEKGALDYLDNNWFGFGAAGAENRQGFLNWLQTTTCDTVVFLDRLPGSRRWEEIAECALHAELRDLLMCQKKFHLVKCRDMPEHGCSVLVFTAEDRNAQKPEASARGCPR